MREVKFNSGATIYKTEEYSVVILPDNRIYFYKKGIEYNLSDFLELLKNDNMELEKEIKDKIIEILLIC